MGNYSIPFIAQGVFGRRGLFYIFSLSLIFCRCKELRHLSIHARISEREEGQGEEEGQKTASDFSIYFFSLCFLVMLCSVGRYG